MAITRMRNHQAEYRRCLERVRARGLTRSQARGHARVQEAKRPPKRIEDERLRLAFRVLCRKTSLSAAARAARG
jgi:hypothetical protein